MSVVGLDSVYFELPKPGDAPAPQPKAGTSTDMRLFNLAPIREEAAATSGVLGVPLFFEPTMLLEVDGARQQPFFFRRADLSSTWSSMAASDKRPQVATTSLEALVSSPRQGRQFQPHSDAVLAWLQGRMTVASTAFKEAVSKREAMLSAKEERTAKLSAISAM